MVFKRVKWNVLTTLTTNKTILTKKIILSSEINILTRYILKN
jgi:hypothetical protein